MKTCDIPGPVLGDFTYCYSVCWSPKPYKLEIFILIFQLRKDTSILRT